MEIPVTNLSMTPDPVAAGWLACITAIAATILLVKEADELTLGQELFLKAPHSAETFLRGASERWVSNT